MTTTPRDVAVTVSDPLADAGRGAVAALLRVVELYDPAAAHRSALRAIVAARLAEELGLDASERAIAIAAAALTDIDLTVAKNPPDEPARDATRAVLAAELTDRVPGLGPVSDTIRHQLDRWDAAPDPVVSGDVLPITSQILAVADQLVGNPAPGYLPTWTPARRRIELRAGSQLDPRVVTALRHVDLAGIDLPLVPSATVTDLLEEAAPLGHVSEGTAAASGVAAAVSAATRVDEMLQLFADIAVQSIDAADVAFLRLTPASIEDDPIARATDGSTPPISEKRLDDLAEFSTLAELRAGVPILRTRHDPEAAARLAELEVGSDIAVPIMLRGEPWGIVTAARRAGQADLDLHDLSVLRHVAAQAAVALGKTVRWEQIEQMALRDQLTGLANRHVLNSVLDEIFERDPVERQDCAVIMCDVDGLKLVNDEDGHEAGDRLLMDAAAALRGAIRDPDTTTICRIGGDEFCLVIDGGALLTAHEISTTIERLFERSAGSGRPRSISCGIAFASLDVPTRSDLLRAADINQYETKRARKLERGEPIPPHRGGDRRALRD